MRYLTILLMFIATIALSQSNFSSGTKTILSDDSGNPVTVSGSRLNVNATFANATTTVPSWSKNLRYDDMNASTGGITRGTDLSGGTWTTIYSYSGSGFISGFLINTETFSDWEFKLIIDSETIFSFSSSDLTTDTLYDVDDVGDVNQAFLGVSKGSHDRFIWHAPLSSPVYYSSNITIQIRKNGGAKKFQSGLIVLSKES